MTRRGQRTRAGGEASKCCASTREGRQKETGLQEGVLLHQDERGGDDPSSPPRPARSDGAGVARKRSTRTRVLFTLPNGQPWGCDRADHRSTRRLSHVIPLRASACVGIGNDRMPLRRDLLLTADRGRKLPRAARHTDEAGQAARGALILRPRTTKSPARCSSTRAWHGERLKSHVKKVDIIVGAAGERHGPGVECAGAEHASDRGRSFGERR
jgi:hypothetical protein